jgi:nuclear pore complex protein Nup93
MSLFMGKGTPATATATGSLGGSTLFGASTSGAAPGGSTAGNSIFGSTTTGNSLFGKPAGGASTTPTTQQQQPATGFGSSLFGASTTTPKQSLFGGPAGNTPSLFSNAPAPTQAPGASLLSSTLGGTQNGQQQQQAPPSGALFDSLLAKNKKEAEGEGALGELPSLQLGLGDLRQRLKELGPSQDRPLEHGKAHYFLAASGVDPGAAVRDLGAFGLQARAERGAAPGTVGFGIGAGEVDVETYLSNLQTKTTLSMIADGLERSVRDFDAFLEENVTMEWEEQRKRIYQHFGIKPREDAGARGAPAAASSRASTPAKEGQGTFGRSKRKASQAATGERASQRMSAWGRSALQRSVIGTPTRIGSHAPEFADVEVRKDAAGSPNGAPSMDDRFQREKQSKLAEKIHEFNNARQKGLPFYLCRDMAELESKSGDRHADYIVHAYQAIMEIVGEDPGSESAPRERQFAKLYLDPNAQSANAIAMRKQILKGANSFLEKQFMNELQSFIDKHPQDANPGGLPDVVNKVKAFIRLREARKMLVPDNVELQQVNGEYVWAIVFYLLRGGHVSEAAQYVNSLPQQFQAIDRTFPGYINSYAASEDRRLKRQMQDRCASEYLQRMRNAPEGAIDPFRMACYKIIGRCDLSNRSLDRIPMFVNDWIWLQFTLARETDRSLELAGESYGLSEVQASIREIGLKHFPKSPTEGDDPNFGMFFYLQVLSGMFEQAIAYLYPFSYVDAVHFAITLTYYGLLRPADAQSAANELLSHNTRSQPQINFGRMLGYYTRDFRAANPAAAVDYLVLICLNADEWGSQQQAALCHEALRELVLESREFSRLIGDIRPDGQRIKGVIEQRGPLISLGQEEEFIRTITLQAASFADDNGRTTDAVLLFHLAGDYDMVVSIVSRALSEAVSLEIGEDPMKLVPVKPRGEGTQPPAGQGGSSLSVAAIDDPVELAKTMMSMYERDHMFRQRIRDSNRIACAVLLQMSEIKSLVEAGKWPQCLDVSATPPFFPISFSISHFTFADQGRSMQKIRALEILPLTARGDQSVIRTYAARFSSLPQPVAINVPNLLLWTIICCTKQRERLMNGQFSGNESTARLMIEELKQMSVDLTAYTSQLRYRLPPHLHEALARASAD